MSARVQTTHKKTDMSKKRTYAPTTDELNEAVEDYLHDHPLATLDKVRAALTKQHITWVIPDRRLKKFIKRQKAGKPVTAADDSTLTGSRLKNFFTIGSAPKKAAPAAPATVKKVDREAAPAKKAPEPVAPPPEPEVAEKSVDIPEPAYVDDNDGKKDNTCASCEGCVIL